MKSCMSICLMILGAFAVVPTPLFAAEPVTVDNFVRAETDFYLTKRQAAGYFGKLVHLREPVDIEQQPVVRANRDTLYSYGVFDLTSPVTISLPAHDDRFQSIRVINQDHYIIYDTTEPGEYSLDMEKVGTRYVHVNVRTLVSPDDSEDVEAANALQDKVNVSQEAPGIKKVPDLFFQKRCRKKVPDLFFRQEFVLKLVAGEGRKNKSGTIFWKSTERQEY